MLGLFEEINHTHTDTLTTFNPVTTSVFLIIDKKGENETVKVEMLVVVRLGGGRLVSGVWYGFPLTPPAMFLPGNCWILQNCTMTAMR